MEQTTVAQAIQLCLDTVKAEGTQPKCALLVGTTYIIGEGNDIDVLVLVPENALPYNKFFEGWESGGSESAGQNWQSYKRGNVNLLLTNDEGYYTAWAYAAEVCRLLHLKGVVIDKATRLSIHNVLMDDKTADEEVAF